MLHFAIGECAQDQIALYADGVMRALAGAGLGAIGRAQRNVAINVRAQSTIAHIAHDGALIGLFTHIRTDTGFFQIKFARRCAQITRRAIVAQGQTGMHIARADAAIRTHQQVFVFTIGGLAKIGFAVACIGEGMPCLITDIRRVAHQSLCVALPRRHRGRTDHAHLRGRFEYG